MSFLHSANCRKLTPQRLTCLKSALAKAPQPKMSIARLVRPHAILESSKFFCTFVLQRVPINIGLSLALAIATINRRTIDFLHYRTTTVQFANGIPGVFAHEGERIN